MSTVRALIHRSKPFVLYGLSLALLIFVLKWLQWKFLIRDHSVEVYMGLIAVFFTAVGIWVATQLTKAKVKTVVVEREIYLPPNDAFTVNERELENLKLTNREYEILLLITQGLSNADIAEQLFLSLSTVKTHVSNLYVKMDVKRRAQAIEKAKRLKITP